MSTYLHVKLFRSVELDLLLFVLLFIPFFLSGCGSPRVMRPADAEIERNAAAAKTAYANGAFGSAALFYRKALDRARLADQSSEIARLAYNLAFCRAQAANYDEAFLLLDEAQYEAGKTRFAFPEAALLRAEILRRLGKTNEAAIIVKSEIDFSKKNDPALLELRLFLVESACEQNDHKLALEELHKLDQRILKAADSAARAKEANLRGRVLLAENQPSAAADSFIKAAGLYQEGKRYADMGNALYYAGAAYAADKKAKSAFDCYYRAARTLFFCGDNKKAEDAFKKASELTTDEIDRQMLNKFFAGQIN